MGLVQELIEYVEHDAMLSRRDDSGVSQREHLEQVERQIGYTPEELIPPPFPHLLKHIWSAFIDLNSSRTSGMAGPNPITFTEIKTWMELTGSILSYRDVETIKKLDLAYLGTIHG